jgi:hypothetical protein
MPVRWEDIRDDLIQGLVNVFPPLNKEQQNDIVAFLQARGHDIVWNALRYVFCSICYRQVGGITILGRSRANAPRLAL